MQVEAKKVLQPRLSRYTTEETLKRACAVSEREVISMMFDGDEDNGMPADPAMPVPETPAMPDVPAAPAEGDDMGGDEGTAM